MSADPTLDALWAALEARPGCALALGMLADYLAERGRGDEEECLRWAAEAVRAPWYSKQRYFWCPGPVSQRTLSFWLPAGLFAKLTAGWNTYSSYRTAYRDLCFAWKRCRAAGIDPPTGEKMAAAWWCEGCGSPYPGGRPAAGCGRCAAGVRRRGVRKLRTPRRNPHDALPIRSAASRKARPIADACL